ncbi:germination protein [Alicyclobacillus cellulosilyticus]|uniref:Germination protein n=1 Tax=Alicyclobacillus cellulosilyticus TaxID=1003997 RepID=A0A917KHP1_9BACL|nr:glycosyl hydrolase family 18 protein [Alicyclobacillus cellulosilyticus]GGJ14167.1 germination protein [Alicyclobacillus cellulosilyticus]
MWMYTTRAGDRVRAVAERIGTTAEEIFRLNELDRTGEVLPPGLHLLYPGPPLLAAPYAVRPGDDLAAVARRIGVDERRLAYWLGVPEGAVPAWRAGEVVYVPQRVASRYPIEVNAYLLPTGSPSDARLLHDVTSVTYLSVFSYTVRADGTVLPRRDEEARQAALRQGMVPLLTLTNFDGNRFNRELAHMVLTRPPLRQRVVEQVVGLVQTRRFGGVMADWEGLFPADRDLYTSFIADLAAALRGRGFRLAVSLPPRAGAAAGPAAAGDDGRAYDYRALGRIADFVELRTYEWGWVGGPPNPIAPYPKVRDAVDDVTRLIPPGKVLMGISLYGYDWPLPYPDAGRAAKVSNNTAQNLAIVERAPVGWDAAAAAPRYRYEEEGTVHEVWFEDALSAVVKLRLVADYRLRGVSMWVLPNESPQTWYLVKDAFVVRGSPEASARA